MNAYCSKQTYGTKTVMIHKDEILVTAVPSSLLLKTSELTVL